MNLRGLPGGAVAGGNLIRSGPWSCNSQFCCPIRQQPKGRTSNSLISWLIARSDLDVNSVHLADRTVWRVARGRAQDGSASHRIGPTLREPLNDICLACQRDIPTAGRPVELHISPACSFEGPCVIALFERSYRGTRARISARHELLNAQSPRLRV